MTKNSRIKVKLYLFYTNLYFTHDVENKTMLLKENHSNLRHKLTVISGVRGDDHLKIKEKDRGEIEYHHVQ